MTSPHIHDDPLADGVTKVLQALAVLTTVGESAARYAATAGRQRIAQAERSADADRLHDAANAQADRATDQAAAAQRRADRQLLDGAFDDTRLATMDLGETAVLWRTAATYAVGEDQHAVEAMHRAEDRLSQLNPGLVAAYRRYRDDGRSIADAMREGARETWDHQTRHADGSTAEGLGGAVLAELASIAAMVDADKVDQLERQWRSSGHAPAADAAARLAGAARALHLDRQPSPDAGSSGRDVVADSAAQHLTGAAEQEERRATLAQGIPGLPATASDEHRDGIDEAQLRHAASEHDRAGAAMHQRLARAFPPLDSVVPVFSHEPAPAPTQPTTTRRKGSSR